VIVRRVTLVLLAVPVLAMLVVAAFWPAPEPDARYCNAAGPAWMALATVRSPGATDEQVGAAWTALAARGGVLPTHAPSSVRDDWSVVLHAVRARPAPSAEGPSGERFRVAADAIARDYRARCQASLDVQLDTGGLDRG